MYRLVVLITPQLDKGYKVAELWQQQGAPGVTLVDGYGLFRIREATRKSEVLPGFYSMLELLRSRENSNVILLSLVDSPALADQLVAIADATIEDLSLPDHGIAFVLEVEQVVGLIPN